MHVQLHTLTRQQKKRSQRTTHVHNSIVRCFPYPWSTHACFDFKRREQKRNNDWEMKGIFVASFCRVHKNSWKTKLYRKGQKRFRELQWGVCNTHAASRETTIYRKIPTRIQEKGGISLFLIFCIPLRLERSKPNIIFHLMYSMEKNNRSVAKNPPLELSGLYLSLLNDIIGQIGIFEEVIPFS